MRAITHLKKVYPMLVPFFSQVGPARLPQTSSDSVLHAIVNVVIGQMLSGTAAGVIRTRVSTLTSKNGNRLSSIDDQKLPDCGLSRRKIRTIKEIARDYDRDPGQLEGWRNLPHDRLVSVVSGYWGLARWSAEMLSIFYFGNPDVFPIADTSIQRATRLLESHYLSSSLDTNLAAPHRSTLAMHLWASLDKNHWKKFE